MAFLHFMWLQKYTGSAINKTEERNPNKDVDSKR